MHKRNYKRNKFHNSDLPGMSMAIFFIIFVIGMVYMSVDGGGGVTPMSSSNPSKVLNAARAYGLKNPKVTGSALFECGKEDSFLTSAKVSGTNMQGDVVTVIVCCSFGVEGFTKGCTVRF